MIIQTHRSWGNRLLTETLREEGEEWEKTMKAFNTHVYSMCHPINGPFNGSPVPVPFTFNVPSTPVQCPFIFNYCLAPVQTGVLLRKGCVFNATRVHREHLLATYMYEWTTIQKSFGCHLAAHGHSPFNMRSSTVCVYGCVVTKRVSKQLRAAHVGPHVFSLPPILFSCASCIPQSEK